MFADLLSQLLPSMQHVGRRGVGFGRTHPGRLTEPGDTPRLP
ncbi:hypothetical protein I546_6571 [Mycobacterium kansasii 732]|nr:hypothetical protein I546_6571 [Mycobacterium kansasii 732]